MYNNKPWSEQTDEELANHANTGMGGQGAIVEALRRHRVELVKQQRATNLLTWALALFAVLQIALQIFYRS